jgi:hypothetical protein
MKRPYARLGVGLALWFGAAAATGCTPSNKVKPGQPVMLSFGVVDPTGMPVELETEAGPTLVPPLSTFHAVFDRLLDPTVIEELKDAGPVGVGGVAVIDWSGRPVANKGKYTPNGDAKFTLIYAPGPSVDVLPDEGLPSDSMLTVSLNPEHIRSHDQTMAFKVDDNVAETLMFTTEALAVTIAVPAPETPDGGADDDGGADGDGGAAPGVAPPVAPDFIVPVTFNNQTAKATVDSIKVTATVGAVAVALPAAEVQAVQDEANAALWTVPPPKDGWPAGAVVTVTVDTTAADKFEKTLGAAVTATFTVKP